MTDTKKKMKNTKDKIAGEVKEAVGKATNNKSLEMEGKIQSSKSDLRKKVGEIKGKITGK